MFLGCGRIYYFCIEIGYIYKCTNVYMETSRLLLRDWEEKN